MKRDHQPAASAFFARPDDAERAVAELVDRGVPRDLVEVIVSPEASKAHYGGRARRLGSQTARFAGAGALIGLLVGITLSFEIIVAFPGFDPPARELSYVQFLGPNVTMMLGILIGAAVGALVRRRPSGIYARTRGREDVLVAVRGIAPERLDDISRALETAGGREVTTHQTPGRRLRWL